MRSLPWKTGYGYLKSETGAAFQGIDPASVKAAYADGKSGLTFPDQGYGPNDPANIGPNFQLAK